MWSMLVREVDECERLLSSQAVDQALSAEMEGTYVTKKELLEDVLLHASWKVLVTHMR